MKTIMYHLFRDMGVALGHLMGHVLRSRNPIFTVAVMPIVLTLLFMYLVGCITWLVFGMHADIFTMSKK